MSAEGEKKAWVPFFSRLRSDRQLVALLFVYGTVFVDLLGVSILVPVLPFLVAASPHPDSFSFSSMGGLRSGAAMAAIMVAFNAAQLVSVSVFGPLSDYLGRRPLLLASLVGGAVGAGLQGVAILMGNFWLFIAARVFAGLFGGSRAVAVAYIADTSPVEKRARLMGLLALSVTAAMQFGSVLGGSLGSLSLSLPCFVTGGVSFLGFVLVWEFVPESRQPGSAMQASAAKDVRQGNQTALVLNSAFSFCMGFWAMAKLSGIALLMPTKFDFNPNQVGLVALGDGMMVLVGNPIYLFLIKRVSLPVTGFLGCLLMALTTVCAYTELAPTLIINYVSDLGGPIGVPCASALVSIVAPAHRRGAWTGITLAMQALGRTIGPLLFGITFDEDYHLSFWLIGAFALVGGCAYVLLMALVPSTRKVTTAKAVEDKIEEKDLERVALNKSAELLIARLQAGKEATKLRLESAKAGVEPTLPTAERRAAAKAELNDWLVDLMESQGYRAWPDHLDGMKLLLYNAIPKVRVDSEANRLTDIIQVIDVHIDMASKAGIFNGADDLATLL
mmetsp:Transcript_45615/g.99152  ORF Transcript_45615/g.99152 Transcript_45615/m.99152 type:complete len:559 (+) Transcript_45615:110-1786(+)